MLGRDSMDNERIFRTSVFGGFKKVDVLQYVEELKKEISDLNAEIIERAEKLKTLTDKVEELSAVCDAAKETEKQLVSAQEKIETLEAQNQQLKSENAALLRRVETIDAEKQEIDEKTEQVKRSEAQLGAAFLDARKYSDEIVTAANLKATETQNDASMNIEAQAAEIAKLSADVDTLADTLTKSVSSLHADIMALSLKLTKAAQSLKNRKDAEKFVPDISIKIENELNETTASDIEAKEDNGLTYIHYPANAQSDTVLPFGQHSKEG